MTKKNDIKAGQYWAAAYHGDNGDLIVGRVKSVRTTGEVVLVNLISEKTSTKAADILRRRNRRVSKAQAIEIVEAYKQTGRKPNARAKAVEIVNKLRQPELPLEQPKLRDGNGLTAKQIDENVQRLVRDTNAKIQLVLAEFASELLNVAKGAL